MKIKIIFYSYFREVAGAAAIEEEVSPGESLGGLLDRIMAARPKLAAFRGSALAAVGVEYQKGAYLLREGDEVSLFPPVQGG